MHKFDSGKRLTVHKKKILDELIAHRGDSDIGYEDLIEASVALYGKKYCFTWIRKWGYENRNGRGKYSLKALKEIAELPDVENKVAV